ncbi:Polyketide synthase PksJ [Madurella mycetomatis]|uniref:Polyketide synthase PksJ n=1 Tax=Madurella mycetomatis TaxID=100816 RepID=A0A175W5A1_9PEZI|nr:Polyketide synthase PksJ [Madurella mycetomatis]
MATQPSQIRRLQQRILDLMCNAERDVWCLPVNCWSSPLSNVEGHRSKHLQGVSQLLESLICTTRAASLPLFENGGHTLKLYTVESLDVGTETEKTVNGGPRHYRDVDATYTPDLDQLAALILTSGSTGNAKAVRLRHAQMLAAVAGKMSMRTLPAGGAFLNWIGLDHVAALVETHLPALWLGLDQDLSNLAALISGGEANNIKTCLATAAILGWYGAPSAVIQPGFGTTETCAGSIYNVYCASYDVRQGRTVASLGTGVRIGEHGYSTISGSKMRTLFEAGAFDEDAAYHRQAVETLGRRKQQASADTPATVEEELLRTDIAETKGLDIDSHCISSHLGITIATIVLMKNPTVWSLAAALDKDKPDLTRALPITDASSFGRPAPRLLSGLSTPGVGEVLVLVSLAQHMKEDDRPLYALRARGFEPDQQNFTCIAETVGVYVAAIRRRQLQGLYAIAGYSFGAMLAFEMAKKIESAGETVGFLGSFNLPPHVKCRMRQLTWNMCLLYLGQFLGLVDDETVDDIAQHDTAYYSASQTAALGRILALADAERLGELGLSDAALLRWADVAHDLQDMAVDYELTGSVGLLDVFHAEPLRAVAPSRDEWVRSQLSQWQHFCRTDPRLHEVGAEHYTMVGPEHS